MRDWREARQSSWVGLGVAAAAAVGLQLALVLIFPELPPRLQVRPQDPIEVELVVPPMAVRSETQPSTPAPEPQASTPPPKAAPASPAPGTQASARAPTPQAESQPPMPASEAPPPSPPAAMQPVPATPPQARTEASPAETAPREVRHAAPAPAAPQRPAGNTLVAARPDYLSNPPPAYPALARRRGWAGTVLLKVRVSASGVAREVQLLKGSGHEVLDQAARQAVEGWHFIPAKQNGEPVESWVEVPVRFELAS
ncbi:MAG: TonB family protein [Pseudomonadota bacterium]